MENETIFRLIGKDNGMTELEMHTTPVIALSVIATGICDIAKHIQEVEGEEASMASLSLVEEFIAPKKLWDVLYGRKRGFWARLKDKIFN